MKRDADPERRARYLGKEREKYAEAKATGKKKAINDLSERDQRKLRKSWKLVQRNCRKRKKEEQNVLNNALSPPQSPEHPRKRGRKEKKRDRARCYKRITLLETKLANEKAKTEKYRKRLQRLQLKYGHPDSPRTKTRNLLRSFYVPPDVRKTLHFHNVLTENILMGIKPQKHRRISRPFFRLFP